MTKIACTQASVYKHFVHRRHLVKMLVGPLICDSERISTWGLAIASLSTSVGSTSSTIESIVRQRWRSHASTSKQVRAQNGRESAAKVSHASLLRIRRGLISMRFLLASRWPFIAARLQPQAARSVRAVKPQRQVEKVKEKSVSRVQFLVGVNMLLD